MGFSTKQMVIYATLMTIGGGVGWASHQYFAAGNFQTNSLNGNSPESAAVVYQAPQPTEVVQSNRPTSQNFIAAAVQKVGPAVVRIDASRKVSRQFDQNNPILKRFFGEDETNPFEDRVEQGTGSGFIVSSDGHVITNAHVVEKADAVTVTLKDGRSLEGKVVGIDPVTDVAAIKIDSTGLPTVVLGSSKDLVPGQWAIAIGNPLGLDSTVTAGIISAIDRSSSQVGIPDRRVQFIQTDAAINPGNSGGPLLNDQGEVIGINTAIRADAQGLGFAIPIETGWKIAQQLFDKGRAEHPYLGIQMVDLTPDLRERINNDPDTGLKINVDRGVLIIQVISDAPAASAGLKPGDVILKINGTEVATATAVQQQIEAIRVGEPLSLEFRRQDEIQTVQLRPIAFPAE
ncbi:MAG: trypsin-like peptidase domain-containing protein [Elainella sp. Prado103]|jgi:S1-C subfamily serine protease|nr:trypsin-like peptidase domain-containing protein [Elainella sp. Prado103]